MNAPSPKTRAELSGSAQLLGCGILNWPKSERVSDRYGVITLCGGNIAKPSTPYGRLLVKVTEPRKSTHIGDFFRGLFPSTPELGDIILLGEGKPFQPSNVDDPSIGLEPIDDRSSDWLNPRALYDVHESVVELYFEPREKP